DRGKRGGKVLALLERRTRPDHDVGGNSRPTQYAIAESTAPPLGGRIVWHDEKKIVVAVGAGLVARARTEQVHALRLVCLDEAADQFGEHGIRPKWDFAAHEAGVYARRVQQSRKMLARRACHCPPAPRAAIEIAVMPSSCYWHAMPNLQVKD